VNPTRKPAERYILHPETPFAAKYRRVRGVSLIEVMIAALILVIAIIGTSGTYVSGRQHIVGRRYYQGAAQLASERIEQLKAAGYENIAEGVSEESDLSVGGVVYVRRTSIALSAEPTPSIPKPCKKATVTIEWTIGTQLRQASLVTYIGP